MDPEPVFGEHVGEPRGALGERSVREPLPVADDGIPLGDGTRHGSEDVPDVL
mgnify:CR=1 FL=1